MLDNVSKIVLNYIKSNAQNGKYLVVTLEDILSCFSPNLTIQKQDIKSAINTLFFYDFIKVKYDDGSTFCVLPTERGLNYKSEILPKKFEQNFSIKSVVGWSILASFLGAIVGVIFALFFLITAGFLNVKF